jgi:polar amino acid transport system substrate-binding protein
VRKIEVAVIAAVLATVVTACGRGQDDSTFRVGSLPDSKPNAYLQNGDFTGFDNELLRAIADREGLRLEFTATDFATLLGQVANGRFDIGSAGISQTDARKRIVDFSNAYNYEMLGIEATAASAITDENSLAGKRIGVVLGTISDTWLSANEPGARVIRFPSDAAVLGALNTSAVDGALFDRSSAELYANEYPGLRVTKSINTLVPQGYAVRRGNGELLTKINNGLREVIADGTWVRLHRRFEPDDEVPIEFDGNP